MRKVQHWDSGNYGQRETGANALAHASAADVGVIGDAPRSMVVSELFCTSRMDAYRCSVNFLTLRKFFILYLSVA